MKATCEKCNTPDVFMVEFMRPGVKSKWEKWCGDCYRTIIHNIKTTDEPSGSLEDFF